MNLYEAKETFEKLYPNKTVNISFDQKCYKKIEICFYDGLINENHHIEYDKVKMEIEDLEPTYIPIQPHRDTLSIDQVKNIIDSNIN